MKTVFFNKPKTFREGGGDGGESVSELANGSVPELSPESPHHSGASGHQSWSPQRRGRAEHTRGREECVCVCVWEGVGGVTWYVSVCQEQDAQTGSTQNADKTMASTGIGTAFSCFFHSAIITFKKLFEKYIVF